ncbi:MAG: biotin/lipoyl-binding protein [Myxococcales bacterium]|nr:biotin/lipoyl-binding protein [Myxococcales bacterium]
MTTATLERRPTLPDLLAEEQRHRTARHLVGWGLGLSLVAAAVAAAVWTHAGPTDAPAWRREAAVRGDVTHEVSATGRLEARGTVSVGPEISGRVASVEVDFNDRVRRGQVLARLDTSALRAQRDEASAAVHAARVAVHAAELAVEPRACGRSRRSASSEGPALSASSRPTPGAARWGCGRAPAWGRGWPAGAR